MPCRAKQWANVIMTSGIPYSTIEKEPFHSFIEKEVGSLIRKTYADVVVGKREREMMEVLIGKDLYVAFDKAMEKPKSEKTNQIKCAQMLH